MSEKIDFETMLKTYQRYIAGDSIRKIAGEVGIDDNLLREELRSFCEDEWDEAKKKHLRERLGARAAKYRHNESRCDVLLEDKLDSLEPAGLSNDDMKIIAAISKIFADKANLAEGKATERIDGTIIVEDKHY